jgi:hypothetical protein
MIDLQTTQLDHRLTIPKTDEELRARATAYADAHVAKVREALQLGSTLEDLHLADNDADVDGVLGQEHSDAFKREYDTLATLMQMSCIAPSYSYTVTMPSSDLLVAAETGLKFNMDRPSVHQLAERMIYDGDDKIDLARGFQILMEVADSYHSYDAAHARLSVPEAEYLDYDGIIATDARYGGCGDPRVIIRELMKMFGDKQIRDLVNERIEAMTSGVTYSIHVTNAMERPKIVKIGAKRVEESAERVREAARVAETEPHAQCHQLRPCADPKPRP